MSITKIRYNNSLFKKRVELENQIKAVDNLIKESRNHTVKQMMKEKEMMRIVSLSLHQYKKDVVDMKKEEVLKAYNN